MFKIVNATPFNVETAFLRDRHGAEVAVVCIKGTFRFGPDRPTLLAEKQRPITPVSSHRGDPGASSLVAEGDIGPAKPATDILLNGTAFAPRGRPTRVQDVSLTVGPIHKTLRVFGDRQWRTTPAAVVMTDPEPFLQMPLIYERAFGGPRQRREGEDWDMRNPIGTGFVADASRLDGTLLPNIERPDALISFWRQRPAPAGFGAVERHWSPRPKLAGTYDDHWLKERMPLLPDDFDDRFYLSAPTDQQPRAYLFGGEPVELRNLTPEGLVRFALPNARPGVSAVIAGGLSQHVAHLDTVLIEPDLGEVVHLWRTMIPCHRKTHKIERLNIWLKEWIQKTAPGSAEQPAA